MWSLADAIGSKGYAQVLHSGYLMLFYLMGDINLLFPIGQYNNRGALLPLHQAGFILPDNDSTQYHNFIQLNNHIIN